MTTLRAAVAALLLLGLSALAPVLAGLGLVTAVAPLVRYATMPGRPLPSGAVVALLCVVAAIVTLGYGVLGVARAGVLPPSVPLRRSDAPALWRIMKECAGAAGSRAPTEIRLTLRAGADVVEDTWALGLIPGSRRLYLGLP